MDKLVAVDQVSRRVVADVYYAMHDPCYQWYYQSSMGPDEGVLFKSWDNAEKVLARSKFQEPQILPYISICFPSVTNRLASLHPLLDASAGGIASQRLPNSEEC